MEEMGTKTRVFCRCKGGVQMTFSQRERFIYHATTLMTMSNLGRLTKTSLNKKLETMRNSRCKNLLDKQIEEVLLDLEKEV